MTTVKSADGFVTAEIPDGALPPGVTFSIEARTGAQASPELKKAGQSPNFYALLPAGTQFAEPVRIFATVARKDVESASGIPLVFMTLRGDDGKWEWLADAAMTLTADKVVVEGTITHVSALYVWPDFTDIQLDPPRPLTHEVGTRFTYEVRVLSKFERPSPVTFANASLEIVTADTVGATMDPLTGVISYTPVFECRQEGSYEVQFSGLLEGFGADLPLFKDVLKLGPTTGVLNLPLTGQCASEVEQFKVLAACMLVHHDPFEQFLSWLEFLMWTEGATGDVIEVVMEGANNDKPVYLTLDSNGRWRGPVGIDSAGIKKIVSVVVYTDDDRAFDLTKDAADLLGDIVVPAPPEERTIGKCM